MDTQINDIVKMAEELNMDKGDLDQKLPELLAKLQSLKTAGKNIRL